MRHRSVLTALLASLLLLIGPPITAQALPDSGSGSGSGSLSASPCHPGTPPTVPKTTNYYDGKEYLGPDPLPQDPPVGSLLTGYQRFGNLTEAQFIAKYRTPDNSMWIYPPDDGFLIIDGRTAAHPEVLQPGKRIDRFGAPSGKFLAQDGESYGGRAIPPQNLNSPGGTTQSDYHLYCVLAPFQVEAGPAQPWFEQPGLGTQYVLDTSFQPYPGGKATVQWLLDNHYLVEEIPG